MEKTMSKKTYAVQERTAGTAWRTESAERYTQEEAERVVAELARREPINADGQRMEYRAVEAW